jgi:hypothetical protein
MRKIYLSVIGFSLLCRLNAHAQTSDNSFVYNKPAYGITKPAANDTAAYQSRKLKPFGCGARV